MKALTRIAVIGGLLTIFVLAADDLPLWKGMTALLSAEVAGGLLMRWTSRPA